MKPVCFFSTLLQSKAGHFFLVCLLLFSPLFFSTAADATGNWITNGPEGAHINSLAIDPVTPSTLYIGTRGGGIYKSTDSGENWSALGLSSSALLIDPSDPDIIYSSTSCILYKSINGGESWTPMNNGLPDITVKTLAIDPVTPTTNCSDVPEIQESRPTSL